jgi:hypothetical protein
MAVRKTASKSEATNGYSQTPEGYISKDIISYPYIPNSPKKDISYHFLKKIANFGIEHSF